jgi:hypothetical protein
MSVYRGDYHNHLRFLREQAHRYEGQAEWVASRMASWWKPVDRDAQVWAYGTPGPPSRPELKTDLSQFGPEVPKPKRALWTSTALPGLLSPWLESGENLQRSEPHRLWKLGASSGARVAEVHSPFDWWGLASAYPSRIPGFRYALVPDPSHPGVLTSDRSEGHARCDPDWGRLAEDWDAVHVSMAGVMTAEDVAYERDGFVTELRGWEMESTVWLRWVFTSVEELRPR